MLRTRAQEEAYAKTINCYLCRNPFVIGEHKWDKVGEHDNLTGMFLGAANNLCDFLRTVNY